MPSIPRETGQMLAKVLTGFYHSYETALKENGQEIDSHMPALVTFLNLVKEQLETPYAFDIYHERLTRPFDYYQFGLDFLRPIVKMEHSSVLGNEYLDEIRGRLQKGESAVLFSNHQTEPDPQAISLLLEKSHRDLAEQMIFVAGHRVTTDPLAVPFSKGRNLLCIYSKNYIEHPPEKKHEKVLHNQKAMRKMRDLLAEGGKCIYVAPSGGRDRVQGNGAVEVAPFDPQSIEMFYFAAKHSGKKVHFYPLALYTYDLLPPPDGINVELGEARRTKSTSIHLALGQEIAIEQIPCPADADKQERRSIRAAYFWEAVKHLYLKIRPN